MNGRERLAKVLSFETVDRLPNYELGTWPQTLERWFAEGLPRDVLYSNWFEGEPYLDLERRGFAPLDIGPIPGFDTEVLEEDERYITMRHPNGIVTKALKEGSVRGERMSMDQYISHPVTDRQSFRSMMERYNSDSPTRYPLWWDEWVRMWRTCDYPLFLLQNGTFGLYSQLRSWVGTEDISYLFYDDPAFVEEMLEFATEFLLGTVEQALNEVEFDHFNFFEDFAGKGGPLIGPDIFDKFFVPRYKRIIKRLRSAGVKHFWLDSDGYPEVLIPQMIDCGITVLWPLEAASGMDPVRLRKEYGKNLALAGGIDKRELSKDRSSIEKELQAKISPLLSGGGYVPHLDHTFPPDIPYDNFLFYLEEKSRLIASG